jgi:hypothetical protein
LGKTHQFYYGWGRGETAGAFYLAMVIHAVFAVVSGNLIDRFGPRALFPHDRLKEIKPKKKVLPSNDHSTVG